MLTDWGSWDVAFNAVTAASAGPCEDRARRRHHVCVPLQGSGTFAVEAAIGTLVPKNGKILVPVNGAYCKRIARLRISRPPHVAAGNRRGRAAPAEIDDALARDPTITHVAQVHCETGTGILNPLPENRRRRVAHHRKGLIVDAMSSLGAMRSTRAKSRSTR